MYVKHLTQWLVRHSNKRIKKNFFQITPALTGDRTGESVFGGQRSCDSHGETQIG